MSERTSIVNISGDHEETVLQLAKHLGTSKIRRKIFNAIYGRGTRARSRKQIMDAAGIPVRGTNAQQAQNELNHLHTYHLIVRIDNDGSVKDGAKFLYRIDKTVRANKREIIKYADNPKAAARIPTKRRPAAQKVDVIRSITKRELRKRKTLTVLYLVANPDGESFLRVDAEVKAVQEKIRATKFRENIKIEYRPAANLDSLIDGLNDHLPQIVHFSGHSDDSSIATDSGKVDGPAVVPMSYELFSKALRATDTPPTIVVLNSCKSSAAKKALMPLVKIVVAMRAPISDTAAAAFAPRFYAGIASGQSVKAAFEQGKVAVEAVSIGEIDTPQLLHVAATNPAKIILA